MFMNFADVENKSVKNTARAASIVELEAWLKEHFGEANVTQTGSGDFAVALGEKDGKEVCVEFGVTAKDAFDRQTPKSGLVRAFDREAAGQKYKADRERAAANRAARKAVSEKNKARDEAEREKAKADQD